ncbi:probable single myb histone 3 at N-terminal half [Coccomyxa sp. Obi]|nr:probable single myb histone 3 at N-terminal half [Coccomyxa sp. Obi]
MSVRCYRVWTAEEEEALRKGVQKHGIGSWEIIRQDANYRHLLADRTGVQLKDKWRNLVKFKHVSRVEADVAASKSATINSRRASGGSDRRGRNVSAEPLVEIERQRQENIARNKQALAALMSNVEQPQASTARRRRPAVSNGDQWHEVQEQLLHAFDALAGAVGESVVAEAAALACSQIADSPSAQDSERQDCRVAVRWQQECARKIQAAEADVRDAEDACQAAAEAEAAAAAARQARRHRQTSPPRPQRASKRAAALERKRYADYEYDIDHEGDDGANSPTESSSPKRFRHTRFTTEDRRFGIYDERRYQASAILQHGAKTSPRPRASAPPPSRAAATAKQGDGETGMVDCPCGVTYDDGQGMIECERCKVWAHLLCLQLQMSQHPRHFHYNFEHYMCDLCQHELRVQAAQVGSRSGRASPRSTAPAAHRKNTPACTRPEAFSSSLPLAQASLDSARMNRVVVPSSGGQPLASVSPFAKAPNGPKSQRRNTHDGWGASAAHSRKVEGNSEDEKPVARSGGRGRSNAAKGGRSGRGRGSSTAEAQPQHPARLLDSEDARHYSGFLGNMSGSEELSMDVPDLLASLLELGGAVPNAAARGASPPPGRAARAAASNHWESAAEAAGPRRGRDRHHKQSGEHGVHSSRGGHQWDGGREQWETPTVHNGSRRPSSDASLPLHEAWMQHEAEWANMHGLRHTVSQEGAKSGTLRWGERNLRTPRHPRTSRVLWPTCLEPLVSRPGQASGRANIAPPSLWEPSPIPKKPRKANHQAQQASSSSQSPRSPEESSGQLHHMRHLRDDHHHRHSPGEPQFTSRRLPHSRSHRDMNGRRHSSHGRGDSPTSRLPKSTPGRASSMEHRGGQLGHLNGPMAVSLGDMPMEALDAALAGLDGDPHHELALDQAAMDLHDNDEVQAGELEQVVSGASEGSGGQLARTSSHYMGPVASDSLAHTWMHHAWADAGHVLNRQSLPPKKAAAAAASAAAEAQAAADAAAAEAVGVAFGVEDMGGNLGVSELDSRPESPSPKDEGLGDLAAHLVAFHNMGASPSHDDPFASGTAKVSFDDGDGTQAGDGAHSPHAHSQRHNGAPLMEQDHAFDGSDRATPLGLGSTEEGEGEMFAEIDQMINVNQDAPLDLAGEGYSEAAEEAQRPDMLEAA